MKCSYAFKSGRYYLIFSVYILNIKPVYINKVPGIKKKLKSKQFNDHLFNLENNNIFFST